MISSITASSPSSLCNQVNDFLKNNPQWRFITITRETNSQRQENSPWVMKHDEELFKDVHEYTAWLENV